MKAQSLYLPLNGIFLVTLLLGAAISGADSPRIVYLVLLFAICSTPLLSLHRINDRYALLALFMSIYFLYFGMIDFEVCLGLSDLNTFGRGTLDSTELLILLGGIAFLAGYHLVVGTGRQVDPRTSQRLVRDWPIRTSIVVGVLLIAAGSLSTIILQIVVAPDKTAATTVRGYQEMGPYVTALLILGAYVPTLGLSALAYGYAKSRSAVWLPLVIAVLFSQVILAMFVDIKNIALMGALLVVVTKALVDQRVPWRWAAGAALGAMLVFPVLQAYRGAIGEGNTTRGEAAANFGKYLQAALESRNKVTQGRPGERAQSIFERSNLKPSVDVAMQHVGVDVPFQEGHTLTPLLTALVPRILLPDKKDVAVGILFNSEFRLGAGDDTYISPSHLGELYWNFGWLGAFLGMGFIGAIFGWVGRMSDLSGHTTLTRLLMLLSTFWLIAVGFESSIATPYAVWIRTMLMIGLMHLLFARPVPGLERDVGPRLVERIAARPALFPNLLR